MPAPPALLDEDARLGLVAPLTNRGFDVLSVLRVAMMLDWIADQPHASRLFVWGHLQQLLERGFRLPGYSEEEVQQVLGPA